MCSERTQSSHGQGRVNGRGNRPESRVPQRFVLILIVYHTMLTRSAARALLTKRYVLLFLMLSESGDSQP